MQPEKVGWVRKFCGKGIFREIWKNRYVVLKGDQLYISEKEVRSVSFSFPIPPSFPLHMKSTCRAAPAFPQRLCPDIAPTSPAWVEEVSQGLLFPPSQQRRNLAWVGVSAPTASLTDSSGWETFSQHWTHERIHLARVKTLILLSATMKMPASFCACPLSLSSIVVLFPAAALLYLEITVVSQLESSPYLLYFFSL